MIKIQTYLNKNAVFPKMPREILNGEYMENTQEIFNLKLKYRRLLEAQSLYLQKANDCKSIDAELANSYYRAALNLNERIDNLKSQIDRATKQ